MELHIEKVDVLSKRMTEASRRLADALKREDRDLDRRAEEYAAALKNYRLAVTAAFNRN